MAYSLQAAGLGVFSQALLMTVLATTALAQVSATAAVSPTATPSPDAHAAAAAAGYMTLDQALHLAVDNNPDMAKAAALIERARGAMLSARARPNPELGIDAENMAGSGAYTGTGAAEFTYGLSQKIELGGKRRARIGLARIGSLKAEAEAENIRHELIHAVKGAYMAVLAAEAEKENAAGQKLLAEKISRQVGSLHAQGGETRAQVAKASVMKEEAELDMVKAEAGIRIARQALALLTGKDELADKLDAQAFAVMMPFAGPADAEPAEAPLLRKASLDVDAAQAGVAEQKSRRIIDTTVGVGVRQFHDTRDNALVANVSIPIPLFDRNSGGVVQAQAALAEAEAEQAKARRLYRTEVARLKLELENSQRLADKLAGEVVPAMRGALEDLLKGYASGRNSLLDVQDVNRSLREASRQMVEVRLGYHLLLAELQHVTATHSEDELHTLEKEND